MLDKILKYVFNTSKQPVLLKDLLVANNQFNERLQVDNIKLGYRMKIGKAYLVYLIFVSLVGIPVAFITHKLFANIDSHASILAAVFFTAIIFIWFNFFRIWLKDKMAEKRIRSSWKNHFPYFSYDEYRYKVEEIFHKAMKAEIQKKDLLKYVLDKLVEES